MEKQPTEKEYRSKRRFISPSDIKGVRTLKEFEYKRNKPHEHKDYFDIGTAFHTLMLEPQKFADEVTYIPEKVFPTQDNINQDGSISMRGAGNKKASEEFQAAHGNKIVLREKYWKMIRKMTDSALEQKTVTNLLDYETSIIEQPFFVKYVFDPYTKKLKDIEQVDPNTEKVRKNEILVKTRPDLMNPPKQYGLDVKSCMSVDPEKFARDAATLEYNIQAVMGLDIVTAITGQEIPSFFFIACEKQPPYDAVVFDVLESDLDIAREIYLRRLLRIKEAYLNKEFPGFQSYAKNDYGVLVLKMPEWYTNSRQYATW
jgi:hypothetical protein